jgi:hypothetical protein
VEEEAGQRRAAEGGVVGAAGVEAAAVGPERAPAQPWKASWSLRARFEPRPFE